MTSSSQAAPRPVALEELLDGIAAGSVVLPEFQRDFDWSSGEIVSLLSTLLCGWPAGSLLLVDGDPAYFRTREFEGAPQKASDTEYVVLDGQQRLTALYRALRNVGDEVFALEYDDDFLEDVNPGAETLQERIRVIPRDVWSEKYSLEEQARQKLIPMYSLRTAADFFEWRDAVAAVSPGSEETVSSELSRVYRNVLGTINHYDFPCVILSKRTPSEAVARIFERINRQVRKLNTFDLMVARTYQPDWNLRDLWETARQESSGIDAFLADDGLPAIQVIALTAVGDVRQPAVLDLSPEIVREQWDRAIKSIDAAINQVQIYGVQRPDWLPYSAQLLTLGGLAWSHDLDDYGPALERWFWGSSLGTTYDVGSSTRVVSDLRSLIDAARVDGMPLERPLVGIDSLIAETRRRSPATWRTFMALLARSGARDPLTGELLDGTAGSPTSTVISLFPRHQGGGGSDVHLRVFGLMRVSRSTARQFRSPIARVLRTESVGDVNQHLKTQFLPPIVDLTDLLMDPLALLEKRVLAVLEFLEIELGDLPVQLDRGPAL